MSYKRILISVDDSAYSVDAVKKGAELAAIMKAEIGLVHVIDESQTAGNIDAGISPADAVEILHTKTDKFMKGLVNHYFANIHVAEFTPIGKPYVQILKTAEQWNADLIITGTHRTSGWRRLIIGSISEDIIRHSSIPVLVVPHV